MKMTEKDAWLYIAKLVERPRDWCFDGVWAGVCEEIHRIYFQNDISIETRRSMTNKVDNWKPFTQDDIDYPYKAPFNSQGAKYRAKMCREEAKKLAK